jgi:hypothetical protein
VTNLEPRGTDRDFAGINPIHHGRWRAPLGSAIAAFATLRLLARASVRFRGLRLAANFRTLRTVNVYE